MKCQKMEMTFYQNYLLEIHFSMNHAMFSSYQVFYYEGLGGIYIDKDAVGFNKITLNLTSLIQ